MPRELTKRSERHIGGGARGTICNAWVGGRSLPRGRQPQATICNACVRSRHLSGTARVRRPLAPAQTRAEAVTRSRRHRHRHRRPGGDIDLAASSTYPMPLGCGVTYWRANRSGHPPEKTRQIATAVTTSATTATSCTVSPHMIALNMKGAAKTRAMNASHRRWRVRPVDRLERRSGARVLVWVIALSSRRHARSPNAPRRVRPAIAGLVRFLLRFVSICWCSKMSDSISARRASRTSASRPRV